MIIKKVKNLQEMARVGFVSKYEIYVNTNDSGNIPHFHMRDKNDWKKFHTCIEINKPIYFHHDGKEDVLNSKQRKALCEFMNNKVELDRYKDKFNNNWELICFLWDINNSNISVLATEMPDYSKIEVK